LDVVFWKYCSQGPATSETTQLPLYFTPLNCQNWDMQAKKLFKFLVFSGLLVGVIWFVASVKPTTIAAANVTYKSLFANDNCTLASGTTTIPDAKLAEFDAGKGVDVTGIGRVYKASSIYLCCYEQYVKNVHPASCANHVPTHTAGSLDPWFASSQGDIYTRFGVPYSKTPTSGFFLTNPKQSKVAEFTYSSAQNPATRTNLSYSNYLLLDYDSPSTRPPVLSGFTGWYDYTKRLVEVNTGITAKPALTTISGNITGAIGTTAGAFSAPGNVTISAGAVCNTRAIIFVEGNLTINPSFKLLTPTAQQACLFIVKGNVSITAGNAATVGGVAADSIRYDLLQIGVISQSEITTAVDGSEGLKVEGFLSAQGTNFMRDTTNANYPSIWVEYDPRYIEYFKEELKLLKFSTREKGFVPPI
jgi:hypothetical protein